MMGTCRPTGHIQPTVLIFARCWKRTVQVMLPHPEKEFMRSRVPSNLIVVFHVGKHILTRIKVDKKILDLTFNIKWRKN